VYGFNEALTGAFCPYEWQARLNVVPTKKQLEEAERLAKKVDWAKLNAMSDEEIRAAWAWDKDMTWPTEAELAEFDLVIPAKARRKPPKAAE
jgi:hypothetical protein